LLLPAFLGCVHCEHGTFTLLASIIIMLVFQYLVAAPFYHDFLGGNTGWTKYFELAKFKNSGLGASW
jgi:hypothetical protein